MSNNGYALHVRCMCVYVVVKKEGADGRLLFLCFFYFFISLWSLLLQTYKQILVDELDIVYGMC